MRHPKHLLVALLVTGIVACAPAQHPTPPEPAPGGQEAPARKANHLAGEQSLYLLQHRFNPVDWYPWGDAAFEKAAKENKPVLLSIGYAACHWCHVMERESFENDEIAGILNAHYVCIKVDREERPDVDRIYMQYCQARNGRGGWPLNAFLTAERKPFYVGTYWPVEDSQHGAGFKSIITNIAEAWKDKRDAILEDADRITRYLENVHARPPAKELPQDLAGRAAELIVATADQELGGFGGAPKFPMPSTLLFLLRHGARSGDTSGWDGVRRQLDAMAAGGIRDHLAGGFHRYSVDARWFAPHFEKMLYDQALLAVVYLEASQALQAPRFLAVSREILDFCIQELRTPEGGFISALDADAEHEEGLTYIWSLEELEAELDAPELKVLVAWSACTAAGNWPEGHGRNILHQAQTPAEVAKESGLELAKVEALLRSAKTKLLAVRPARPQPARDDKVLAGWNALMISALARFGAATGEEPYLDAARSAATLIEKRLLTPEGTLLRSWTKGVARHPAELFDHAAWLNALLDLHEATLDLTWLEKAKAMALATNAAFRNPDGRWIDSREKDLIITTSSLWDGAVPSGTSLACLAWVRLGILCADDARLDAARQSLLHGAAVYDLQPTGSPHAYLALDLLLNPSPRCEFSGPRTGDALRTLRAPLRTAYEPFVSLTWKATEAKTATALVCVGHTCLLPATTPEELKARLMEAQN